VRHAIRNLVAFYEMEARAAHALLSHAQRALEESGREADSGRAQEGPAQTPGNRCLRAQQPNWQDKMDREIEDTEARLLYRVYECDRTLEVLTGNGQTRF